MIADSLTAGSRTPVPRRPSRTSPVNRPRTREHHVVRRAKPAVGRYTPAKGVGIVPNAHAVRPCFLTPVLCRARPCGAAAGGSALPAPASEAGQPNQRHPRVLRLLYLFYTRPPPPLDPPSPHCLAVASSVRNGRGRRAPARWPDSRSHAYGGTPSPPIAASVLIPTDAVVIEVGRAAELPGTGCRICHLGPEDGGSAAAWSEVIRLGCGCKDDLGAAHRQCAEAWFRIRGDRRCEICGSDAKNITGLEVKKFMEQWHGRRVANIQTTQERGSNCWRQQPFCNFLLASILIVFMLPWFLRVNLF